uniref:Uncharacterized protein n=1 Tax=Arundo donax TaxID=35708 RepID=A0A0A9HSW2_ARUDO
MSTLLVADKFHGGNLLRHGRKGIVEVVLVHPVLEIPDPQRPDLAGPRRGPVLRRRVLLLRWRRVLLRWRSVLLRLRSVLLRRWRVLLLWLRPHRRRRRLQGTRLVVLLLLRRRRLLLVVRRQGRLLLRRRRPGDLRRGRAVLPVRRRLVQRLHRVPGEADAEAKP